MSIRIRNAAVGAALALPLVLGACSSGGGTASPTATNGSPAASAPAADGSDPFNAQAGQEVDKSALLDQTQQAMMDKKTYAMNMQMAMGGQTMKVSGVGDMTDTANLKVKMTMEMPGASGQGINMLLIGKTMYMQMPGQAGGKYVKVPMSQLQQAGGQDFEKLLNPAESLRMSKDAITKATYVGEEDVSGTKLKHFTLLMDMSKANAAAGVTPAPNATGPQTVPYDVWVDSDKLVRKMELSVQGTKMTSTLDKYGEPVKIDAPPTDSVTTMPGLSDAPTS